MESLHIEEVQHSLPKIHPLRLFQYHPVGTVLNPDSVAHAVDHNLRTAANAIWIQGLLSKQGIKIPLDPVLAAISVHDVCRWTDYQDEPEHGALAVKWFQSMGYFADHRDRDQICWLVRNHSFPHAVMDTTVPEEWRLAMRMMQTADALEWLKEQHHVFDPQRLHFPISQQLVPYSRALAEQSRFQIERIGSRPIQGVINAGIDLGIFVISDDSMCKEFPQLSPFLDLLVV